MVVFPSMREPCVGARAVVIGAKGAQLRAEAKLSSLKTSVLPAEEVVVIEELGSSDGTPRCRVRSAADAAASGWLSAKMLRVLPAIRVLGLHGGGASAAVMKFQTGALARSLRGAATFEFVDGARPWAQDVDKMLKHFFGEGPYFGWYGVTDDGAPRREYSEKLMDPTVNFTYSDLEAGLERVEAYIREHGPFDVLLGFSQGTIVSTLLTARRLASAEPPSWRGLVLVCGMPPRDHTFLATSPLPLAIPAAFFFSKKDGMYEYGQGLLPLFAPELATIGLHDEGHVFPRKTDKIQDIADAILRVGSATACVALARLPHAGARD